MFDKCRGEKPLGSLSAQCNYGKCIYIYIYIYLYKEKGLLLLLVLSDSDSLMITLVLSDPVRGLHLVPRGLS